ncbi:alpha/beta fold hydrolase [Streptomyces hirsutus]
MTDTLLNHRTEGSGSAPPLLLGPSLGTFVRPVGQGGARVVGRAPGGPLGPAGARRFVGRADGSGATVGDLADLVIALADALDIERFAYAGVSLGGAVGLELAVRYPQRVSSLAVICSSAHFNGAKTWEERAALVRSEGLAGLAQSADSRWFTPGFTVPELVRDHRGRRSRGVRRLLRRAGRVRPAGPPRTHRGADAAGGRPGGSGDAPGASARDRRRGAGAGLVEIPVPRIWRRRSARRRC